MSLPASLLLVGCGKMGTAMVHSWKKGGVANITVIEPQDLPDDLDRTGLAHVKSADQLAAPFDTVVLAVKPQAINDACREIRPFVRPEALVLSIAAGIPVQSVQTGLDNLKQPVVRAMPNTPASIGRGITGAFASSYITPAQKETADSLLQAMGKTVWLEEEQSLNAVTALSGSGPAYVFLLIEVMAEAGKKLGLPKDTALHLARETVIGSAALAESEHTTPVSTLRQNVTSPGGTTAAALAVLMEGNALQTLLDSALQAAHTRAQDLSR